MTTNDKKLADYMLFRKRINDGTITNCEKLGEINR